MTTTSTIISVTALLLTAQFDTTTSRFRSCPPDFVMSWKSHPPYTELVKSTGDPGGILHDVFRDGMSFCCSQNGDAHSHIHTSHFHLTSKYDLKFLTTNDTTKNLVDFFLPLQRNVEAEHVLGYPFMPVIVSPGFALFVRPPEASLAALLGAMKPVLPIMAISLLTVAISGVTYWLLESWALAWSGDEHPEPFFPGVLNGMWWAFITMTTIGYGDIVPKTKPGRIFTVLWILVGITLCGILVSSIASVLIETITPKELEIRNQEVAVMAGSEEYHYTFKKLGRPHQHTTLQEVSRALTTGNASMAIVDVLIASRYKEEFSGFVLERIIEHVTNVGVVFFPRGQKYTPCLRQFIMNKQRDIINNVSSIIKRAKYKQVAKISSSSIIDPSTPGVQYALLGLVGMIALLLGCGVAKQKLEESRFWQNFRRKRKKASEGEGGRILLREVKEVYQRELVHMVNEWKQRCETGLGEKGDDQVGSKVWTYMSEEEDRNSGLWTYWGGKRVRAYPTEGPFRE